MDGKYLLACVRLEVEARAEACRRATEQRALELGEEVEGEEEDAPALAFCRLWELYEELKEKKRKLAEEHGEDDESSDESDEDEEPDEDLPKKTKPARPRQRIAAARKAAKPWNWKGELGEILRKYDGVAKTCASRPSTAPFGNWGLIKGAQRLREDARRAAREAEVQALIEDADDATAPVSSNDDERQLPARTSLGFSGFPKTRCSVPEAPPSHIVISLLAAAAGEDPHPLKGTTPRNYRAAVGQAVRGLQPARRLIDLPPQEPLRAHLRAARVDFGWKARPPAALRAERAAAVGVGRLVGSAGDDFGMGGVQAHGRGAVFAFLVAA